MKRKPSVQAPEAVDVPAVRKALEKDCPDGRWLRVLEVFLPTGVADYGQVQRATGLSRDQLDTLLERMGQLGRDTLVRPFPFSLPRPGVRGRPPVVYGLGEAGAALLRSVGYEEATACGLGEERAVAHARAVLDVHLAAKGAGLAVRTEAELAVREEGPVLRPDNVVVLPNGVEALYEVEQEADSSSLRRVTESLRRKAAFFRAGGVPGLSPVVRMVFAVAPERLEKTLRVWEEGLGIVAGENGGSLPFRLVAMLLTQFLEGPDWSEPPEPKRWRVLQPKVESRKPGAAGRKGGGAEEKRSRGAEEQGSGGVEGKALAVRRGLPPELARRTAKDDLVVMEAYWQDLLERGPALAYDEEHPRPDPAFFEVMKVIYAASYDGVTVARGAAYPYASVYLLRKYLEMHPRLRESINRAIRRGRETMRWNVTTILHRMQRVIRVFLRYHGYEVGRWLVARPETGWGREEGPQDFWVAVRMHPEVLMGEGETVVPGPGEVRRAEEALAWVLWALFAYAEEIGLTPPPFW